MSADREIRTIRCLQPVPGSALPSLIVMESIQGIARGDMR